MSEKFNLTGISKIYSQALSSGSGTLSFEIRNGIGCFVFIMFFSKEDSETLDHLYLYLRNSNTFLRVKLYGSHRNGDFFIYITTELKEAIRAEVSNGGHGDRLQLLTLLTEINASIPSTFKLSSSIETLQNNWDQVKTQLSNYIEDSQKIYLIGVRPLQAPKRPQEKTLRKLYLHTKCSPDLAAEIISKLKKKNCTLMWSATPPHTAISVSTIMSKI